MTETSYLGVERRQKTNDLIEELLKERRQMWALYWELAELKPFDQHREPLGQILNRFCQLLIDYVSLGHFGLYQRIVNGTERRQKVLQAAKALYPAVAQATEVALAFNSCYEAGKLSDPTVLMQELSKLGEALATRIELEDRLIASMFR
ncbi:Rsd/AlgQ family anti-sigma factor [Methylothermus subterraneus]